MKKNKTNDQFFAAPCCLNVYYVSRPQRALRILRSVRLSVPRPFLTTVQFRYRTQSGNPILEVGTNYSQRGRTATGSERNDRGAYRFAVVGATLWLIYCASMTVMTVLYTYEIRIMLSQ